MKITLNGHDFDLPDNATIASLVEMRRQSGHLKTPAYAVERNKEVIPRQLHPNTPLAPNDKIEIVVMVGGG
jgi:thiamine biosynthesis protein ThiS